MASSRIGLLLAGIALMGAAPPQGDPRVSAALAALAAADLRVASVAYRLQTSSLSACRTRTTLPGLIVQDSSQYRADLRPAMAALFNVGTYPAVTGVVRGGPADRAGIRAGDEVLALDGATLMGGDTGKRKADGSQFSAIVGQLGKAFAQGRATFSLRRAGVVSTRTVIGAPACASVVQLDLGSDRNAGADGATVTVSQGLLDFTQSDDELAFVLGHELSHNILGHRSFLDSTRHNGGLFGGDTTEATLETERQADYWGLYLVAWAGYDVRAAGPFWARIAKAGWLSALFPDPSHPGNRSRARDLDREADEILAQRAAHRPLVPDYAAFEAVAER